MGLYKLEQYDPLAKRRAILQHIGGDNSDRWVPVAWVDYDDVGRDEADEKADAMLAGLALRAGDERYVTFFPWGDHRPSGGYVSYGPFGDLETARAHARTLSSDPDEGEVARLEPQPPTEGAV